MNWIRVNENLRPFRLNYSNVINISQYFIFTTSQLQLIWSGPVIHMRTLCKMINQFVKRTIFFCHILHMPLTLEFYDIKRHMFHFNVSLGAYDFPLDELLRHINKEQVCSHSNIFCKLASAESYSLTLGQLLCLKYIECYQISSGWQDYILPACKHGLAIRYTWEETNQSEVNARTLMVIRF